MANATPRVEGDHLRLYNTSEEPILVESSAWYDWLDRHDSFAVVDGGLRYTARKERRTGGAYWYAFRTRGGKLRKSYLGASRELTRARLRRATDALSDQPAPTPLEQPQTPPDFVAGQALLRTKLVVPAPRPRRIERSRLHHSLRDDACPLTIVVAPAGYGKTTLLADWIVADRRRTAWVALDAGDNDPLRFWTAVAASLDRLQPQLASRALALLQNDRTAPASLVLPTLINDLDHGLARDFADRPLLLVLDDYHQIEEPAIHEALTLLCDRLPAALRLVILSRSEPPLALPRLRARGQLVELRMHDLAMTVAETLAFLNTTMGLTLDDQAAAALTSRTEGWLVALQLASLSLRGHADPLAFIRSFGGSHRQVLAYLVDEVVSRLSPGQQLFLLATSVLDRLNGPLCEALVAEACRLLPDSQPATQVLDQPALIILEQMLRQNLFVIPLDDEGRWYRYHQLFAEMLRHRLQVTCPGAEPALRRCASLWLAQAGLLAEAVEQALAAEDWDSVSTLIADPSEKLLRYGEVGTLTRWLSSLPVELLRERPRLGLLQATILGLQLKTGPLAERLDPIEQALDRLQAAGVTPDAALVPLLRARLTVLRACVARVAYDLTRAAAYVGQALAMLPDDDVVWRGMLLTEHAAVAYLCGDLELAAGTMACAAAESNQAGDSFAALFSMYQQAYLLIELGQLDAAEDLIGSARRLCSERYSEEPLISAQCDLQQAWICYERDDLVGAAYFVAAASERAEQGGLADLRILSCLTRARLLLTQGDLAGARAAIDSAEACCRLLVDHGPLAALRQGLFSAWRAQLAAAAGDIAQLNIWAAHLDPQLVDRAPIWSRYYRIVPLLRVRACLAQGDGAAALALLQPLRAQAVAAKANDVLVELLTLESIAAATTGRMTDAVACLEQALDLGGPQRYTRTFLDAGPALVEVVHQLHERVTVAPPARLLAGQLLAGLRNGGSPTSNPLPSEPLTVREQEVLRLLAQGATNAAIAGYLVVSVGTVKSHVSAILSKLGARSRTEAVARGRAIRLLH